MTYCTPWKTTGPDLALDVQQSLDPKQIRSMGVDKHPWAGCTSADLAADLSQPRTGTAARTGHSVANLMTGVDTEADAGCIGSNGRVIPKLYEIGALQQGTLRENVAVPEFRARRSPLHGICHSGQNRASASDRPLCKRCVECCGFFKEQT